MGTDTGFFRRPIDNLGLEFLGPWMALNDGQDVQRGQDLTLIPPGYLEAAFEAVFEVVRGR